MRIFKFNEMNTHILNSRSMESGEEIIDIFQEVFDQYGIKQAVIGGIIAGQQWKLTHITEKNTHHGTVAGSIVITLTSVKKNIFDYEFFEYLKKYIYSRVSSIGYYIRDKSSQSARTIVDPDGLHHPIPADMQGNLQNLYWILIEINTNPFKMNNDWIRYDPRKQGRLLRES